MTAHTPCIALLTDFGLTDPYVGQVHAVLASLAPTAQRIDLCHEISPHSILQAAFFLAASLPWCPPQTVLLAVVDPGVGTGRSILCCDIAGRLVLAPDNGLVPQALAMPQLREEAAGVRCFDLSAAAEGLPSCNTFHGRDRFAPLCARLALGASLQGLGEPVELSRLVAGPGLQAEFAQGCLSCRVLHVDRFGNLLLTAGTEEFAERIASWGRIRIAFAENRTAEARMVRTYAELASGEFGLLAGSQGFLELAANQASASRLLGLSPQDKVCLDPQPV